MFGCQCTLFANVERVLVSPGYPVNPMHMRTLQRLNGNGKSFYRPQSQGAQSKRKANGITESLPTELMDEPQDLA